MQDVITVYITWIRPAAAGRCPDGVMRPEAERMGNFRNRSTLYCGWTNQLDKRLKAHNEGKGAKYTRGRRPVSLAYYEMFETKEEAMQREAAIKRLSRKDKLDLVAAYTSDASYATN